MNVYKTDTNGEELLVSDKGCYVMMEWEKPYMEKSIDLLAPKGDVLEVGWGCGYSATRILEHRPKSYTVIECCPNVIKKAKEWAKGYPDVPIRIIEGKWQTALHDLGTFDEIYMDDYPLHIGKESTQLDVAIYMKRYVVFVDLCIQNHTRVGSRISMYINQDDDIVHIGSDSLPFVDVVCTKVDIDVSKECNYRETGLRKCMIPIITKVAEYKPLFTTKYTKQK